MNIFQKSEVKQFMRALGLVAFLLAALFLSQNAPPNCLFMDVDYPDDVGRVELYGVDLKEVVFLFLNYLLTAFLGYALTKKYFEDIKKHFLVKFLAAFFVGFICIVGIARIVSLFAPYHYFYWPTFICISVIISSLLLSYKNKTLVEKETAKTVLRTVGMIFVFSVMLWIVLFMQMRQNIGSFTWAGHGQWQYAYMHDELMEMYLKHFPIIKQHYDELMYHEFIFSGMLRDFDPILAWWVTLGMIKISALLFLYLIFRKLNFAKGMSWVCALFICLGSFSLLATKYYMYFDSGSPLWLCMHSGRIVGVLLMILIFTEMSFGQQQKLPLTFFLLTGIGITATSISNFMLLALMLLPAFLTFIISKDNEKSNLIGRPATFLCGMIIIICFILYGLKECFGYDIFKARFVGLLFVLTVFIFRWIFQLWVVFKEHLKLSFSNKLLVRLLLFLTAAGVGLLFLGNILVENKISASVQKYYQAKGESVPILTLHRLKGAAYEVQKGTWKIGDYRERGPYNPHCHSLGSFVAVYGGILFAILCVNFIYAKRFDEKIADLRDRMFYEIFLLASLLLPWLLFFMDMVDYGGRAWVKSRFLELPVYWIIFTLFYFVSRIRPLFRNLVVILLVVYIIAPFLDTGRFWLMLDNWRIFVGLLKGLSIN